MTSKQLGPEDFPVISVTKGMAGWLAVHYWWNPEDGGFPEPYDTGMGRYATREEAVAEACLWMHNEGISPSSELNLIAVHSSFGDLFCDSHTGEVKYYFAESPGCGNLQNIQRFDLVEYREWARNSTSPEWEHDTETDILLLGYWTKNGVHTLPCVEFRFSCLAEAAYLKGKGANNG